MLSFANNGFPDGNKETALILNSVVNHNTLVMTIKR